VEGKCIRVMDRRADLHVHTTASDGALTPSEVVRTAAGLGLAAVGIADHDTVDGLDEALQAGIEFGIEVVPAVEISATHGKSEEVHVLGYFTDHHDPELVEKLKVLKGARWDRGRRMVEQLQAAGVPVDFERVAELADGGAIGRPHVARALCELGVVSSMDSAFGRYLVEGAPGYVERYKVSPQEAVRMIIKSGGVACCAHPAKLRNDVLLVQMIEEGLGAIEAYHPDHTAVASRSYSRFAQRRGLIVTGGSDAHCIQGRQPGRNRLRHRELRGGDPTQAGGLRGG
jgi:predicted metal-dependent phosphoesterase TrpH